MDRTDAHAKADRRDSGRSVRRRAQLVIDRPAVILGATWLIAVCCLARLLWAPPPGPAPIDLGLLSCVVLWGAALVMVSVARRHRAAALDAAVEAALAEAGRRRAADATMVRR